MEFNNPAKRLYDLLFCLSNANPHMATSEVLATAFGVKNTPRELMLAIVGFHNLVQEVKEYAAKTSLPTGPLARYIPQIESAVEYTNLDVAWHAYCPRITKECLVVLEMIAHLDDAIQDKVIPLEELKSLEASLQDLFSSVEAEKDIDKEFKLFVLNQIEKIRRAISEYRISGAAGFGRYLESLVLEVVKQKDALSKAKTDNSGIFEKLTGTIKKVATFASCASDGIKAIEKIRDAFDAGKALLPSFGVEVVNSSDLPEVKSIGEITIA